MLGGRLSQRRDVTPHEPMWIQLLGSVLTIEGPRRHVLWIYVDANALRLTSLEPSRQGTQEFTCHARSPSFGNDIKPLKLPVAPEATREMPSDEAYQNPVF